MYVDDQGVEINADDEFTENSTANQEEEKKDRDNTVVWEEASKSLPSESDQERIM